jgi:hypothetical protein
MATLLKGAYAMSAAFFNHLHDLAKLFTPEQRYNREISGKYGVDGLKPIEAFCSDIMNDLVQWSYTEDAIWYKTKKHFYEFRLDKKEKGLVLMTRFDNGTWRRVDDWANLSSVKDMGKVWLLKDHREKYVPMFHTS